MSEVVNFVVAVAVIVLVFRWATSGKEGSENGRSPSVVLGFKPKNVTPQQVETVQTMFPDIPRDNVHYDLLRTGSIQETSNKILERGFLPAPPAPYYTLYPRTPAQPQQQRQAAPANAATSSSKPKETLITKYQLQERVARAPDAPSAVLETSPVEHKWETSAEKRESNLRERKARMVLAARERLLAQQKLQASASASSS